MIVVEQFATPHRGNGVVRFFLFYVGTSALEWTRLRHTHLMSQLIHSVLLHHNTHKSIAKYPPSPRVDESSYIE